MEIGKKMVSRLISKAGIAALALVALVGFMGGPTPSAANDDMAKLPQPTAGQKVAVFAGGCFWCIESDMDHLPGVISTTSGYTGGTIPDPTYRTHYKGNGEPHYEALQVIYDPMKISYDELLTAFWHSVDVTDPGGQFCDRGPQYRTAVFVTDEQRAIAEASKTALKQGDWPKKEIVTPILELSTFYPAEVYHQDYYKKNPIRYNYYRNGCRRNQTVKRVWGPLAYKGLPKS
jgi:peptide-methionine (S)-S-oxide reductase